MPVSLNKFIDKAREGGIITFDSQRQDTLVTKGKTIFGKVARWFKTTFKPGRVRTENRRVMEAFITALKESPRYSGYIAETAANRLQNLVKSGKPLTARMVKTIIKNLDLEKQKIHENNQVLAARLSSSGIATDRYSFEKILSEVAKEKDFALSDDLNTKSLKEKIYSKILKKGQGGKHPVTLKEAREVAKQVISDFIETKKQLLGFVNEHNKLNESDKAFWKDFVIKTDIKNTSMLKTIIDAQPVVKNFIDSLKGDNKDLSSFLKVLDDFTTTMLRKMDSIKFEGDADTDAILNFLFNTVDSYIKNNNIPRETLNDLYSFLNSNEVKQLKGGLDFAMSGVVIEDDVQIKHAGYLLKTLNEITEAVGTNIGIDKNSVLEDISDYVVYEKESDLSPDLIYLLQKVDINLPPPDGLNTKGEGTFSPSFIRSLEKEVSKFLKEDIKKSAKFKDGGGINNAFLGDIERRLDVTINGQLIDPKARGEIKQKSAEYLLKSFCKHPKKNEIDINMMRTITTISHQGLWAFTTNLLGEGKIGPFKGVPLMAKDHSLEHLHEDKADISVDSKSGDILVKRTYQTAVSGLATLDEFKRTDPTTSLYRQSFTFKIPRTSIEKGEPEVKIIESSYKFEFNPHLQTIAQRLLEKMPSWHSSKKTTDIESMNDFHEIYNEELSKIFDSISDNFASGKRDFDETIKEALGNFMRTDNANILGMGKFNYSKFGSYVDTIAAKAGAMIIAGKDIGEIYASIIDELNKTENVPTELSKELRYIYDQTKKVAKENLKAIKPDLSNEKTEELGNAFARKAVINTFILRFVAPRVFILAKVHEISANLDKQKMAINLSAILQAQANNTRFSSEAKQGFNTILDNFHDAFNQAIDNIIESGASA